MKKIMKATVAIAVLFIGVVVLNVNTVQARNCPIGVNVPWPECQPDRPNDGSSIGGGNYGLRPGGPLYIVIDPSE